MEKKSSGFNSKIPLTACLDCRAQGGDQTGNNLHTRNDGSTYCFACESNKTIVNEFIKGDFYGLDEPKGWLARNINIETCRKANFKLGRFTGTMTNSKTGEKVKVKDKWVQIAEWYNPSTGVLICQKLRTKEKWFKFLGNTKDLDLWGIHDYVPNDKLFIIITGGELDRLSVMQAQGLQYPVVSPPSGEGSTYKAIKKNLKILMGYKYVVLALDNDEAGRKAMIKAAELFEIHKVRMVTWPLKDPNESLKLHQDKDIVRAIWDAKTMAPESIVTVKDVIDRVLEQPKFGLDWPWEPLTKYTYGIQFNTISTWVGPSGVGKTEIIGSIVSHVLKHFNCAVFSFEQAPEDTIRRYVGQKLNLKLQKPGEEWPSEKIKELAMEFDQKLFLYESARKVDVADIMRSITYLAKANNCKLFVIDNLKSLRIVFDKEGLAEFCAELKALAKILNLHIILVSHVSKNMIQQKTHVGFSSKMRVGEKPHENLSEEFIKKTLSKFQLDWADGRVATASDIEGGNDTEAVSDYVFAIARNKNSNNDRVKRTMSVHVIKCGRIDSEYGGKSFKLYRNDFGILEVINFESQENITNYDEDEDLD